MFFLPVICVILGAVFFVYGRRHHEQRMTAMGIAMFAAAIGTGLITFFALSTLNK